MRLARMNGPERTTPIQNPPIELAAMNEMVYILFD